MNRVSFLIDLFFSDVLSDTDLAEVLRAVYDARSKWYIIGLGLKMKPAVLDTIAVHNSHSPGECLRELLTRWLRQGDSKPTWAVLANVLESPTLGLGMLSKEMKHNNMSTVGSNEEQQSVNSIISSVRNGLLTTLKPLQYS